MAGHLAVTDDVFDGVLFCAVLFPTMSWMRSGTELSQFLRIFLPTSSYINNIVVITRMRGRVTRLTHLGVNFRV